MHSDDTIAPKLRRNSCDEEINSAAKKCYHCGNYQNFKRHLDSANTVIALVLALTTMLVFLNKEIILPIFSLFGSEKSFGMKSAIARLDENSIEMLVENGGKKTVWVEQSTLCTVWDHTKPEEIILKMLSSTQVDHFLVNKINGRYLLSYYNAKKSPPLKLNPGDAKLVVIPLGKKLRSQQTPSHYDAIENISYCNLEYSLSDGTKSGHFIKVDVLDAAYTLKELQKTVVNDF